MEIPRHWRLGKGLYALLNGAQFNDQRDMQRLMVKAGEREETADEALVKFISYVARVEDWGSYSIVDHPFLGSFDGVIDVTEELENLKLKMNVGE